MIINFFFLKEHIFREQVGRLCEAGIHKLYIHIFCVCQRQGFVHLLTDYTNKILRSYKTVTVFGKFLFI